MPNHKIFNDFLTTGLLFFCIVIIYLPALNAGFIWTDYTWSIENPIVKDPEGLWKIWFEPGATIQYYPILFTSFWLDYRIFETDPFGYHAINIILHFVNTIILWKILFKLKLKGAPWIAAIWAIHPVQVETVAWIMERGNLLGIFFFFSGTLSWLSYNQSQTEHCSHKHGIKWYLLTLIFFLCALLSKSLTVTLPAVILLLDWWEKKKLTAKTIALVSPMFLLGGAMGVVTIWVEQKLVSSHGADWSLSFIERCLIAGKAVWFYLSKLVLPQNVSFIYEDWNIDSGAWSQYIFPLSLLFLLYAVWKFQHKISTAPLVAILFFIITLSPMLGFIDIYYMGYKIYVTDHWQYLASVGPIVLFTSWIKDLPKQLDYNNYSLNHAPFVFLILILGTMSWNQARIYENEETLWNDVISKNARPWLAHSNLGVYLAKQGRHQEAIDHWRKAIEIQPNRAEIQINLGEGLLREMRIEEALERFLRALQLNPNHERVRTKIAIALSALGRMEESIDYYNEQLELQPDDLFALNNLAWIYSTTRRGQFRNGEKAVELAERAQQKYGDIYIILDTLSAAYAEIGSFDKAVELSRQALEKANNEQSRIEAQQHLDFYLRQIPIRE